MLTLQTRAHRRRYDDWHRSDGGVWLPGGADVPRVAGDPMRGAGMVRRGMGLGFLPAGCCCGCPPAGSRCIGGFPDYLQVDLADLSAAGECSSEACAAIEGSYILPHLTYQPSTWESSLPGEMCTRGDRFWRIQASVVCHPTTLVWSLNVVIQTQYPWSPGYAASTHTWYRKLDSQPVCSDFDAVELSFYSSGTPYEPARCTGGTATVTAL